MAGLVALWLCCGVATADVIVTNLGTFGDYVVENIGTFGRYEVDIDGNGVWEVAFEGDGTEFYTVVNEHALIQTIPETPPNLGSDAWSLEVGDIVGSDAYSPAVWHRDVKGTATMRICLAVGFGVACAGHWPTGSEDIYNPDTGFITVRPDSGYLAVAFTNATGLHYGWVDVGVYEIIAAGKIYGWAWESDPDTPVTIVPEPESVGLMVLFTGLIWLRQSE